MELIKSHKWLFVWSVMLLLFAFIVKFIPMSKPLTQLTGAIEMLFAIVTGITFGITAFKKAD